jgi:hypothetical protein
MAGVRIDQRPDARDRAGPFEKAPDVGLERLLLLGKIKLHGVLPFRAATCRSLRAFSSAGHLQAALGDDVSHDLVRSRGDQIAERTQIFEHRLVDLLVATQAEALAVETLGLHQE